MRADGGRRGRERLEHGGPHQHRGDAGEREVGSRGGVRKASRWRQKQMMGTGMGAIGVDKMEGALIQCLPEEGSSCNTPVLIAMLIMCLTR